MIPPQAKLRARRVPVTSVAVHAVIGKDIFPAEIRARITAWLRPGASRRNAVHS